MIETIAYKIRNQQLDISEFVAENLEEAPVPIYSSFDIRCNGHKAAAVDPNLFPAGFNNVCRGGIRAASQVLEQIIRKKFGGGVKWVGLYAENHTRNSFYFQNLFRLSDLIRKAGFRCRVVATNPGFKDYPVEVEGADGDPVKIYRLRAENRSFYAGEKKLDLVISNNDFSSGVPSLFDEADTPVVPDRRLGWWNRTKHKHFEHQAELFGELGELLRIDPWFLFPLTRQVEQVDFEEKEGFEEVAGAIDRIIEQTEKKYEEHGIEEEPRAFVKADRGTYGMGVYSFKNGEEFLGINRSRRDSMARRKGGGENNQVIVQEGIRTVDRVTDLVAEPVIYCLEHRPIGGFLRTNEDRSDFENLNSRGMNFTAKDLCPLFIYDAQKNEDSNLTDDKIEVYKLLATVAALACGREVNSLKV